MNCLNVIQKKEYNLSAREAHNKAQDTYNWAKQLMEETEGKGEEDDLLQIKIKNRKICILFHWGSN